MNAALWTLMKLRWRGSRRRLLRQVKTVRGALLLSVWLFVALCWLGGSLVSSFSQSDETQVAVREFSRAVAPLGIFALWLLMAVTPAGGQAIAFTPAEVDFLFPAPFSRRALIAYKLLNNALPVLFLALILSLVGRSGFRYWIVGYLGLALMIGGANLSLTAVSLARELVAERFFKLAHKLALGVALLAAAAALGPAVARHGATDLKSLAADVRGSWTGRCLLAPCEVYAGAITAERIFPDFMAFGAGALAMNGLLVALIFRLDANYLEAAADAGRKRYETAQRMARGDWWSQKRVRVNWRLPAPRWLKGCGPLAWRQALHLLRTSSGSVIAAAVVAVACVLAPEVYDAPKARPAAAGVAAYVAFLSLFSASVLPFGLRADVDRLDYLKTLPLPAWAVVVGELAPVALVLSLIQMLLIGAATLIETRFLLALPLAAVFIPGANLLCVANDNLLFLWFPSHVSQAGPADMQSTARHAVLMMLRIPMLMVIIGVVAGAGGIAYFLCGQSWVAMGVVSWCVMCCEIVLGLAAVSRAFLKFDVSLDSPAQ